MDYELFWRLTPKEVWRIIGAAADRRIQQHDEARARNHELAQLIAWAFHKPDKMPKFQETKTEKQADYTANEERVRAYFIGLSMRS